MKDRTGVCVICQRTAPLVVDHDHATGRIRGRICSCCNAGLGMFRDDVDVMANAMAYVLISRGEQPRPTPMPSGVLLMSVARAAEIVGVGEQTLRQLMDARAVRSVRIGGAVRIPAAEVERLASLFASNAVTALLTADTGVIGGRQ